MPDLERRIFLQRIDHLIIEAGGLAILDELERTVIVFGCNDNVAALLDLLQRGAMSAAEGSPKDQGQQGCKCEAAGGCGLGKSGHRNAPVERLAKIDVTAMRAARSAHGDSFKRPLLINIIAVV
jgi:hypothetical protein